MTDKRQASSTAGLLVSLFCLLACKSENWDLGVKSICHWSLVTLEKFPTHWMVGISITLSEKQTNPMTIHQMQYLIICKTLLFLDPVNVRHPWYLLDVQGLYYGTKGWANLNTSFKLEKKSQLNIALYLVMCFATLMHHWFHQDLNSFVLVNMLNIWGSVAPPCCYCQKQSGGQVWRDTPSIWEATAEESWVWGQLGLL